jgi:hypothetical protein
LSPRIRRFIPPSHRFRVLFRPGGEAKPPTSHWKGEGRVRYVLAGSLLVGPTSLNGGEGRLVKSTRESGGGEGNGGGRGRKEDEPTSTVMGLMSVSNSAHPPKDCVRYEHSSMR